MRIQLSMKGLQPSLWAPALPLAAKKMFSGGQVVAACERGSGLLRLTYSSYKDG